MSLTEDVPENFARRLIAQRFLLLSLSNYVQESIQATFESARHFFRQPLSTKHLCSFSQDMGYREIGAEYSKSPAQPDQFESFSVAARVPLPETRVMLAGAEIFYRRMSETFDLMEAIAEALVVDLADHFTNESNGKRLHGALRDWSRLQMNYSIPSEVMVPLINEEHEDLDLLTLTVAPTSGLEVQCGENTFVPVTTDAGQALVLTGEIAWLLSGGHLEPVYHQVRPDSQIRERLSLLFFADLEPIDCNPWVANELNAGVDIGNRVLSNVRRFGLLGFEPEPQQDTK